MTDEQLNRFAHALCRAETGDQSALFCPGTACPECLQYAVRVRRFMRLKNLMISDITSGTKEGIA